MLPLYWPILLSCSDGSRVRNILCVYSGRSVTYSTAVCVRVTDTEYVLSNSKQPFSTVPLVTGRIYSSRTRSTSCPCGSSSAQSRTSTVASKPNVEQPMVRATSHLFNASVDTSRGTRSDRSISISCIASTTSGWTSSAGWVPRLVSLLFFQSATLSLPRCEGSRHLTSSGVLNADKSERHLSFTHILLEIFSGYFCSYELY